MRDYSDDEIEAYVATGDPMDKAGARHPVARLCARRRAGRLLCRRQRLLADFCDLLAAFGVRRRWRHAVPALQHLCVLRPASATARTSTSTHPGLVRWGARPSGRVGDKYRAEGICLPEGRAEMRLLSAPTVSNPYIPAD
ncbi:MAG: Maf family protein [Caldilineaceae bacterium]|nr:Maf family protein [Caldilineaceae bacterium]